MKHVEKEMRHPNSEIQGGNENTMHSDAKLCQKFRSLPMFTALTLFAALAVQAHAQQIIKFDAPNSGTGAYEGTAPTGINLWGIITGSVTDDNDGTHGFVGIPMVNSLILTFPALTQSWGAPAPTRSTISEWSRDTILTQTTWATASCALPTARSLPSTF